jgi:hypothetical protein
MSPGLAEPKPGDHAPGYLVGAVGDAQRAAYAEQPRELVVRHVLAAVNLAGSSDLS